MASIGSNGKVNWGAYRGPQEQAQQNVHSRMSPNNGNPGGAHNTSFAPHLTNPEGRSGAMAPMFSDYAIRNGGQRPELARYVAPQLDAAGNPVRRDQGGYAYNLPNAAGPFAGYNEFGAWAVPPLRSPIADQYLGGSNNHYGPNMRDMFGGRRGGGIGQMGAEDRLMELLRQFSQQQQSQMPEAVNKPAALQPQSSKPGYGPQKPGLGAVAPQLKPYQLQPEQQSSKQPYATLQPIDPLQY
jgi:hypothetical protein